MIARILGEGQFDVPDRYLAELDTQDEALNEAVVSGDQAAFTASARTLRDTVRRIGTALPDSALVPSGLVLPGSGMSLAQVTALLSRTDLAPVHIRAPAPVRG